MPSAHDHFRWRAAHGEPRPLVLPRGQQLLPPSGIRSAPGSRGRQFWRRRPWLT